MFILPKCINNRSSLAVSCQNVRISLVRSSLYFIPSLSNPLLELNPAPRSWSQGQPWLKGVLGWSAHLRMVIHVRIEPRIPIPRHAFEKASSPKGASKIPMTRHTVYEIVLALQSMRGKDIIRIGWFSKASILHMSNLQYCICKNSHRPP